MFGADFIVTYCVGQGICWRPSQLSRYSLVVLTRYSFACWRSIMQLLPVTTMHISRLLVTTLILILRLVLPLAKRLSLSQEDDMRMVTYRGGRNVGNYFVRNQYCGSTYGTIADVWDLGLLQTVWSDFGHVVTIPLVECGRMKPTLRGIVWLKLWWKNQIAIFGQK
jgi:hypothetical protein